MAGQSIPLFNTDPDVQAQAALLQQRQQLAQALLQQGMAPLDTQNRQIGGVGYRISPLEGLAKVFQAYAGQKGIQDTTKQQAALAAQQYAALLQRNQPSAPDQPPSYTPAQISGASGAALGQGAQSGSVGPTVSNAGLMAKMLAGQNPQGGGPSAPNPYNPGNLPAELLTQYQAGMIPKEIFDAQAANFKPTDATLAARQGGLNPVVANQQAFAKTVTYPKILAMQQAGFSPEMIKAAMTGEVAKTAEIERKGGNQFVNPFLGQSGMVPRMPDNANPVGQVAPNGALPQGVAPMPGAQVVLGSNAFAEQGGRTGASIGEAPNPDGSITKGYNSTLFGTPRTPAQTQGNPNKIPPAVQQARDSDRLEILKAERAKPTNSAADNAALDREIARANGGTKTVTGPTTTDSAVQKSNADSIVALPVQTQQSRASINGLESALRVLDGVKATGPGTIKTNEVISVLRNNGINVGSNGVNDYQSLSKFLANSLHQAAQGTGSAGSDARFDSFQHGQPNSETMNKPALQGAIRYVLSQHDANAARGDFVQQEYQKAKAAGDPNAAQTALQKWTQVYKPEYFAFNRMSPEEHTQFLRSKGKDAAAWVKGYNDYANQTGWVK